MKRNTICRICRSSISEIAYSDTDFTVIQCKSCGFGYLAKYPTVYEAKKIYSSDYFHNKKSEEYIHDALYKFRYLTKYIKKDSRVLDYGCGVGDFIKACVEDNISVVGYDISAHAAQFVKDTYKVDAFSGEVDGALFPRDHFDVIVSFDVIEHIVDFEKILDYFQRWLKPGGILIMTTPDMNSWDAKILGRRWYGFKKFPEHINYFSHESISQIAKKAQFNTPEIIRWGFVRSIGFLIKNTIKRPRYISSAFIYLAKVLRIYEKDFFIPMTDMMVIAKKE